jgi:hypothetical protein
MDALVSAACTRPLDALEVLHVGLQHKTLLAENFVQDVLNGVLSVTLVLHT